MLSRGHSVVVGRVAAVAFENVGRREPVGGLVVGNGGWAHYPVILAIVRGNIVGDESRCFSKNTFIAVVGDRIGRDSAVAEIRNTTRISINGVHRHDTTVGRDVDALSSAVHLTLLHLCSRACDADAGGGG